MTRPFLLLIAVLAAVPPAAAGEGASPRRIRLKLLSYNVHQGAEASAAVLGRFIQGIGADIVSLQEVPSVQYRDQTARAAGYTNVSRYDRGKAIFSKTAIDEEEVLPLPFDRSLIRVTTAAGGVKLSIYGVHISWDVEGNQQARQIVETILPKDPNARKIFLGDFNDEHLSTQNLALESALSDAWTDLGVRPGARTSWPATGWAGSEGHQLIDLLLYHPAGGIFPVSGEVLHLSPVLSDHRPVVFVLELTDPIAIDPPARVSADTVFDPQAVIVRFDREVAAGAAAEPGRYSIVRAAGGAGPEVEEATVDRDRRSVRLRTAPHEAGNEYVLSVEGVPARAGTTGSVKISAEYRHLPNLLANPGAEDGTNGWEVTGGLARHAELRQMRPHSGEGFFGGGAADARSTATQVVPLEHFAREIDSSRATAIVSGYLATGYLSFPGGESRPEPYDDSELIAEALAADGAILASTSSGKYDSLGWHPYREDLPLPPGTRSLRVRMAMYRKTLLGGPQNDGAIDDVHAAVQIGAASHGTKSGNLLANPGAEVATIEPWQATPNVSRLANYAALSGTQAVAVEGDGLFMARTRQGGGMMSQVADLPPRGPLDYLRWGGAVQTWASRMQCTMRVELLDERVEGGGRVLATSSMGPFIEAEWRRHERWTPIPAGAARLRVAFETQGSDVGVFGDAFLAQVVGGPAGSGWFARGDVERDGRRTVTDAVQIFRGLFLGHGVFACEDAADVNDDGAVSLTDGIAFLDYLFRNGPPPPPPGLDAPGPDPTEDGLRC